MHREYPGHEEPYILRERVPEIDTSEKLSVNKDEIHNSHLGTGVPNSDLRATFLDIPCFFFF